MSEGKDKVDSRFVYANSPKWQQGQHQKLQGFEILTILPTNKSATLYEFEFPNSNSVLLFGPMSGFRVKGVFECKDSATALDTSYVPIPAADYSKVMVQPNWFENIVKSVDVFNNNASVKCDDVPRYADMVLNTYLYANMDKELKNYLCPEAHHPARCLPIVKGGFSSEADSEWHNYSKTIFGKAAFEFRYVPMFVFPFFQHALFGSPGGRPPAALPMSLLEKLKVSINFKENFTCIFKKLGDATAIAANTKIYRFRIIGIEMVVLEARLSLNYERILMKKHTPLKFYGVTRYGMVENIPHANLSHRTEIKNVDFPEGIFIFALPKKIIGGDYTFEEVTNTTAAIFSNHNISTINITFNGLPLAIKTPNYGTIRDSLIEIKQLLDHKEAPPFGIPQDPHLLDISQVKEGGENTSYPHVYLNLCPSLNETRFIGIGDDGKGINQPGNLEIQFKFAAGGATLNATYYIYLFYTDVNMTLDPKTKNFSPYYKRVRPAF